jgi:transcriptional regulator with XRE-family HTH domain
MNAAPTFADASPDAQAPEFVVTGMFAALTSLPPHPPAANDPAAVFDAEEDEVPISATDCASQPRGVLLADAKSRLRPIVGERLCRARHLSGLSQTEAAHALGYKTPAQLSMWEQCRRSAPVSELIKCARIYGVSTDFLLGESEEVDRDVTMNLRHACLRGVRTMLTNVAAITVDEVARHARLVGPHAGNVRSLLTAGDGLLAAYAAFVRHNEKAFANQRGGATLQRLADEFESALMDARNRIRLHDSLDADLHRSLAALGTEPDPEG